MIPVQFETAYNNLYYVRDILFFVTIKFRLRIIFYYEKVIDIWLKNVNESNRFFLHIFRQFSKYVKVYFFISDVYRSFFAIEETGN